MGKKYFCDVCGEELGKVSYFTYRKPIPPSIPAIYPPPVYSFRFYLCRRHADQLYQMYKNMGG